MDQAPRFVEAHEECVFVGEDTTIIEVHRKTPSSSSTSGASGGFGPSGPGGAAGPSDPGDPGNPGGGPHIGGGGGHPHPGGGAGGGGAKSAKPTGVAVAGPSRGGTSPATRAAIRAGTASPETVRDSLQGSGWPVSDLPTWDPARKRWVFYEPGYGGVDPADVGPAGFNFVIIDGERPETSLPPDAPAPTPPSQPPKPEEKEERDVPSAPSTRFLPTAKLPGTPPLGLGTTSPIGELPSSAEQDFFSAFKDWNWIIPQEADPVLDDEGKEIVPFQTDVYGGKDILALMQSATPLIARIATVAKLPLYLQGTAAEYLFVRPLEAAPWRLYEAATLVQRSFHNATRGQIGPAMADIKAANSKATEAALAILSVASIGAMASKPASIEAQMEAAGVKYLGPRFLPRVSDNWARAQQWVTGSSFEHGFFIEGVGEMWVDGFESSAPHGLADKIAVEVKLSSKVEQALSVNKPAPMHGAQDAAEKFVKQLNNYVLLGKKLGLAGVKYVICDPNPFSTTTIELQGVVRNLYPELVESGWLRFVREAMPPLDYVAAF